MNGESPKLDLHCHLEGSAPPELIRRLARRNGVALPETLFDGRGGFAWADFPGFLAAFDKASSCIRTAGDYRDVMCDYLRRSAAEGCVYAEVFASPDHAAANGLAYGDMIEGIARGIADGERDFAIVGRIIVTCVRHLGPERALAVAEAAAAEAHPHVVGFGMGGDENSYTMEDFAAAFERADRAGLATTVHAGEFRGADSIAAALDVLPVSRIGHGVRAVEDPALLDEINRRGVTFEVCPGSNLALGLYPDAERHPLTGLLRAGCRVALGSDDPPFFATSIGGEYRRAREDFALTEDDMAAINRSALNGAFCDESTRMSVRERL